MSSWLNERDLRYERMPYSPFAIGMAGTTRVVGLTLNVAFLSEIKRDNFRPDETIGRLKRTLSGPVPTNIIPVPANIAPSATPSSRWPASEQVSELVAMLSQLRDELENHFALEEFYGYFDSAPITNPQVTGRALALKSQHEQIYLDVCELVELAESILYRESPLRRTWPAIVIGFHSFVQNFDRHEQEEIELMMRLCNQDFGVGD